MAYQADARFYHDISRVEQVCSELATIDEIRAHNDITNPFTAKALIHILQTRNAAKTQVGVNFIASLERFAGEEARYKRFSLAVTTVLILGILLFGYIAILPMLPDGAFTFIGKKPALDPLVVPKSTESAPGDSSATPKAGATFLEAFPDDVFRLYVLTYVITDGRQDSDVIREADIDIMAAWKDLDIDTMVVVDRTGIEYFPASAHSGDTLP